MCDFVGNCYSLAQNVSAVLLPFSFDKDLNIVCFLLGNSPASQFYMPTFGNTLSVPSS